jgi:membrane-associated PAP2 superfamily phosphatase
MHPDKQSLDMLRLIGIPLLLMAMLLLFEPTAIDLALQDRLYRPGEGFIGARSFFLEDILHDKVKQGVIAIAVGILLTILLSLAWPQRIRIERKRWLYVLLAMLLASSLVTPLKKITEVQCPWNLTRYGGTETYSALTETRAAPVEHVGNCWPGGHASSGFTLFALFFALRDQRPRAARIALLAALGLGTVLSAGRMLQGAHFLSHNLWTALIDWTVCAVLYRLMLYQYSCPATAISATMTPEAFSGHERWNGHPTSPSPQ